MTLFQLERYSIKLDENMMNSEGGKIWKAEVIAFLKVLFLASSWTDWVIPWNMLFHVLVPLPRFDVDASQIQVRHVATLLICLAGIFSFSTTLWNLSVLTREIALGVRVSDTVHECCIQTIRGQLTSSLFPYSLPSLHLHVVSDM
jgi:hypothetical protein